MGARVGQSARAAVRRAVENDPNGSAFYHCRIGVDYPAPIVEFESATRWAKETFWEYRQRPEVVGQLAWIWRRHVLPENARCTRRGCSRWRGRGVRG